MKTIEATGPVLAAALSALVRLGRQPLPVMTIARVNRMRSQTRETLHAYHEALDPVIRRYTGQPDTQAARISSTHERWAEFDADEEAIEIRAEVLTVDVRPLPLSELVAAEERADRRERTVELSGDDLGLLMELGCVTDDLEETTPEVEEPPKPKARKRARRK